MRVECFASEEHKESTKAQALDLKVSRLSVNYH